MARSRPSKAEAVEADVPEVEEPEVDDSDDEGDADPAGSAGGRPMSKAKAARSAIERGIESPQEASEFILREYGIVMAPQHFSAVKSQLRKKEREAEEAGRPGTPPRRGRRPALDSYLAPPPRQPASAVETDLLDAIEAIKPLVASLGAEKVKRIVELLG
ncbi:thioesterase [Tundrisphaera sp. TA3]|uniref:thioesterase n=1 Tax=Tundrisphaera sp. TA3 TaxID=3435775 RepID=UPI003EB946A6